VLEAGLPVAPPGKMFKKDITGIPLSEEERTKKMAAKGAIDTSSADGPSTAVDVANRVLNFVGSLSS
jgi:hypothetical protein